MNYNDRVSKRLSSEYDGFMESMKQLTGEEAIKHAYEKVFKEDIVSCFECNSMDLSPIQAKALLAEKNSLDYLYGVWMDTDCSYSDMLKDSLDSGIKLLAKEYKQKQGYER